MLHRNLALQLCILLAINNLNSETRPTPSTEHLGRNTTSLIISLTVLSISNTYPSYLHPAGRGDSGSCGEDVQWRTQELVCQRLEETRTGMSIFDETLSTHFSPLTFRHRW